MMMRGRRVLGELDQQIRDHIEQETQDNIERGMSPEEARSAALRKFGSVALAKEDARAVWIPMALEQLLQDLRFGCRILTKSPALSGTAALLVALVIGGNTTVFSIAHGILKKPAPGVQGGRTGHAQLGQTNEDSVSPQPAIPTIGTSRRQSSTMRPILAAQPYAQFTLNRRQRELRDKRQPAFPAITSTPLGVRLSSAGGTSPKKKTRPVASGVAAVISHRAWQDFFGGAPDVIGRSV